MDISGYTEKLIMLKGIQQQRIHVAINQIKQEIEDVQQKIEDKQEEMRRNQEEKVAYIANFYQEIKTRTFSNQDMLQLDIIVKKKDMDYKDLSSQKDELHKELAEVEQKLEDEKVKLKASIRQQEKYSYIQTNYAAFSA